MLWAATLAFALMLVWLDRQTHLVCVPLQDSFPMTRRLRWRIRRFCASILAT